jgi:hypothetical protein
MKKILSKVQEIQSEVKERVKDSKGYGNSFDNGCDTGWFEALVWVESMLKSHMKRGE